MKYCFVFVIILITGCNTPSYNDTEDEPQDSFIDKYDVGTDIERDLFDIDGGEIDIWYIPDTTDLELNENLINSSPEMVIITNNTLKEAWERFAIHRTLHGIITKVVTMEYISSNFNGLDEAEKLRNYIIEEFSTGSLSFVLLGGDKDVVPFRRIENYIIIPTYGEYSSNGPAELYFAELDSDWDRDNDGIYGEKGEDLLLEDLRDVEVAVGRVPVDTIDEVNNYIDKVLAYEYEVQERATYPLLMSDIASSVPLLGDIDAAEAVEVTFNQLFPQKFKDHVKKLYATTTAAIRYGGEVITLDKVINAWNEGYPFSYHNGHGSHDSLSEVIDRNTVLNLQNQIPTLLFSCACLSGNFADIANTSTYDGWREQGRNDDSAGELFVVGEGGGVAYIGNTAVGLGPLGGAQFLHSLIEGIFIGRYVHIGKAMNYARANFRNVNLTIMFVPMIQTDDTEWWTQMEVILLGDPSLAVWTDDPKEIEIVTSDTYQPGYNELLVRVIDINQNSISGVMVTLYKPDELLFRAITDSNGEVTFRFFARPSGSIFIGVSGPNLIPVEKEILPNNR